MRTLMIAVIAASAAFAAPAFAAEHDTAAAAESCGNAPRAEWKSENDIRQSAEGLGYKVRSIKVEDGCYEIYAFNSAGARVEAYLNPVSGELVREKVSR